MKWQSVADFIRIAHYRNLEPYSLSGGFSRIDSIDFLPMSEAKWNWAVSAPFFTNFSVGYQFVC